MRSAVLTALVSVALVTAAGTLGATVVGDAVHDTGENASSPIGEQEATDSDDGDLDAIGDIPLLGGDTGDAAELGTGSDVDSDDARTAPGSDSDDGTTRNRSDGGDTAVSDWVDTDGDDVSNDREERIGSDPTATDTDDDGLSDGRELELGTDPTAADTDGDGLPDGHELTIGTDPTAADTDDDGLDDAQELTVGTDPTEADTDGDRLLDSWEVMGQTPSGADLPDADPLAKDVYVQFDYASGTDRRSEAFYDAVGARFAEMPVHNPDNSTGIEVHVRDGGSVNDTARFTGENFWTLKDRYYESELGARAGVYHQVLVVRFGEQQVGYGEVGGPFNVVAGDLRNETAQRAVTHELLHNVVGRVEAPGACEHDPKHYCEGGYLSPRFDPGEEQYLAGGLARQLERQGFAEP